MIDRWNSTAITGSPTRRQMLTGLAITLGSLAAGNRLIAETVPPTMEHLPGTSANQTRTSLHEDIDIEAGPQRLYEALLSSKQFAAFSGLPAEIDPKVGGGFSMFGGQIIGLNVEFVPNERTVQAWRPTHWAPGVYSIAKFDFNPTSSGTTVALDHTGFPEGEFDHLEWGWHHHYWEPLKQFVA